MPVGRVRFTVVNRADVPHRFIVEGRTTPVIRTGRSAVLLVTFAHAGSYPYRCTVPGHTSLAARGTVTVVKAVPPKSTTTKPATTATPPPTTTTATSGVKLTLIGDFQRPVLVTAPKGDPNHLFVVEQRGTVQEVVDGRTLPTPFLDLTDRVLQVNERGFLGLAFAPDYATSGRLYVDFTDRTGNGNLNVVEYRRSADSADQADVATARQILAIEKPWENHNAGMLQFGPDGYLYVAVGDGDSGVLRPPGTFAQTLDDLLGNILRIDPLHPTEDSPYSIPDTNPFVGRSDARGEIWDYGFRNPWRFWIDPVTGDLYVGDAGEGDAEEIDYVEGNGGGLNFGWPCFEGTLTHATTQTCVNPVPPIYDYDHGGGRCAVIGGVVVQRSASPVAGGPLPVRRLLRREAAQHARHRRQGRPGRRSRPHPADADLVRSGRARPCLRDRRRRRRVPSRSCLRSLATTSSWPARRSPGGCSVPPRAARGRSPRSSAPRCT